MVYSGTAQDARNLLSTLFTAIISMASLVFSVTIVALTLAANQYGSRLIRIFRADRRTQLTLGTFAMTIVYCLVVPGGGLSPDQAGRLGEARHPDPPPGGDRVDRRARAAR